MGHLPRDATRQSRQLSVMADKLVAAPPTPQQLTYAAGGTSILVRSDQRVKRLIRDYWCLQTPVSMYVTSQCNVVTSTL